MFYSATFTGYATVPSPGQFCQRENEKKLVGTCVQERKNPGDGTVLETEPSRTAFITSSLLPVHMKQSQHRFIDWLRMYQKKSRQKRLVRDVYEHKNTNRGMRVNSRPRRQAKGILLSGKREFVIALTMGVRLDFLDSAGNARTARQRCSECRIFKVV